MNSSHGGPILTDPQWFILEGTLQSLRQELAAFRTYRSHRPGPSPRLLLEGILFKLGFGLKWADLPRLFSVLHPELPPFPVRAAQRLYRQLYLSGRMAAIYERLHEHLASYGEANLQELIEAGVFQLVRSRVCLASGQPLTWEIFTALLLLQRAFHNRRALLRDLTAARLSRRGYRRLPFKRRFSRPEAAGRASRRAGGMSCKDRDVGAVGRVGAKRRTPALAAQVQGSRPSDISKPVSRPGPKHFQHPSPSSRSNQARFGRNGRPPCLRSSPLTLLTTSLPRSNSWMPPNCAASRRPLQGLGKTLAGPVVHGY